MDYEHARSLAIRFTKEKNLNAAMSVMRSAEQSNRGAGNEIKKELASRFGKEPVRIPTGGQ